MQFKKSLNQINGLPENSQGFGVKWLLPGRHTIRGNRCMS
jgi:hypothetical protein